MERRSLLRQILRYLFISPYDWQYTLRLPFYSLFPSKKNHCQLSRVARSASIAKEVATTKFIFGGDFMLLNHDDIPILSPEFIKTISVADYFIVNCEAPVVDIPLNTHMTSLVTFAMPLIYLEKIF